MALAALWVGWQIWQVSHELREVADHADGLRTAAHEGDDGALDSAVAELERSSAAVADRTSGTTWSALTRLPVIGDDAAGVRTVSRVIHEIAQDGLGPALDLRDDIDGLVPREGMVPIAAVGRLSGPAGAVDSVMQRASQQLAGHDPAGFAGPLEARFRELEQQVDDIAAATGAAVIALEILPPMLGDGGERNHLLVFQNNAEIRATGGLPGVLAQIHADDGELSIDRVATPAQFGRADEPALPLTAAERRLYHDVLGVYFQSANMSPDFPRVADLWAAHWDQSFPTDRLDSVLTVDTVAMSYVLDATGPITVDGVRLTGDNVVDELLHRTYLRLDDPLAQNAFFAQVAAEAFTRFTNGTENPTGLVRALSRAVNEGRINVHSLHASEQDAISGSRIAGELVTDPAVTEPQLTLTLNDTTGSKMSYFLRTDVDIEATECTGDTQVFTARAQLSSAAPATAADLPAWITGGGNYGTPPGTQRVTLRIFGPVGGSVSGFEFDSESSDLALTEQDGRPVGTTYLELAPGQTIELAWEMASGRGQTGDARLRVTPTIEEGTASAVLPSAC